MMMIALMRGMRPVGWRLVLFDMYLLRSQPMNHIVEVFTEGVGSTREMLRVLSSAAYNSTLKPYNSSRSSAQLVHF